MGGTRDGEVYETFSEEHRRELERITGQDLVPLSKEEALLAKLIPDKDWKSEVFGMKQDDGRDLVQILEQKIEELQKRKVKK